MKFIILFIASSLVAGVLSVPVLYRRDYSVGDIIYANPKDWGQTGKNAKTRHPAVVVDKSQDASGAEQLHIAPISHNHPRNPHQISTDHFHPDGSGNTGSGGIALQTHVITPQAHNIVHPTWPAMPHDKVQTLKGYINDPHTVPEHLHAKSSDSMRTRWQMDAAVAGPSSPTTHAAPHDAAHAHSHSTAEGAAAHAHGHDAGHGHGAGAGHDHSHSTPGTSAAHGHGHGHDTGHGHEAGHGHEHSATTSGGHGHSAGGHGHTSTGHAHAASGPYAAAYAARHQRTGRGTSTTGTHGSTHPNTGHHVGNS